MTDLFIQPIFLLGFGGVGRALARQIVAVRDRHARRNKLHLAIVGIADSASAIVEPAGLTDQAVLDLIARKSRGERLGAGASSVLPDVLPAHTIVVDTTATEATVPILVAAKARGMGVVLANKLPLAGELAWWDALADEQSRWETTCGAALPVPDEAPSVRCQYCGSTVLVPPEYRPQKSQPAAAGQPIVIHVGGQAMDVEQEIPQARRSVAGIITTTMTRIVDIRAGAFFPLMCSWILTWTG